MKIGDAETILCHHTYLVDLSDPEKHSLLGSDGASNELDIMRQPS